MDNYNVIKYVSSGTFGKIYKASCKSTNKLVAIKKINYRGLNDYDKENIFNEAKITTSLQFPFIIQALDVFCDNECVYIIFPYYPLKDLKCLVSSNGKLSEEQIWKIMGQLISSLCVLHKNNIIHRDIKIQNILVQNNLDIILADLGIAKILKKYSINTNTQVGTPYYLSPELIEGNNYSKNTDIWSLGVLLYELIYHKYPHNARNLPYLMRKITMDNIQFPLSEYSEKLVGLCKKMLDKNKFYRPSAQQLYLLPSLQKYIHPLPNNMLLNSISYNKNINMIDNIKLLSKKNIELPATEFQRDFFTFKSNCISVGVQVNISIPSDMPYKYKYSSNYLPH